MVTCWERTDLLTLLYLRFSCCFFTFPYGVLDQVWYSRNCLLFVMCVSCHTVSSVPCSLVVTCWERADPLTLLYVMFSCVFVTFLYGVLDQVWHSRISLLLVFVFRVILSCLFLAALWSPAGKVLLYVIFSCVFFTFPYSVLGQVWFLIVSIPDLCLLLYFAHNCCTKRKISKNREKCRFKLSQSSPRDYFDF